MQQARPEAQKGLDLLADAVVTGPVQPVVDMAFHIQMHHAVGQGRRHAVGHGPVALAVARGHHGPAVGQAVLAHAPVEDELVAGGLYQRGRGVEFVQEEDAFLRVLRMGQEFRHAPGGDALIADAGQSAQVHRVQQHGAQVVELAALAAGHVGHQPALAYTGRPPEEHGLPDAHQMMQCLTDVAGSHAGVLLNKLNFIFN